VDDNIGKHAQQLMPNKDPGDSAKTCLHALAPRVSCVASHASQLRAFAQIEVFYELNSAAIQGAARAADDAYAPGGADDGGGGQTAEGGVFRTQEDRAMLIAMMLHCADISNATKPRPIAERYRLAPGFRPGAWHERVIDFQVARTHDVVTTLHFADTLKSIKPRPNAK